MHVGNTVTSPSPSAERILITGATGFLGGAVAARLIEQGFGDQLLFLVRAVNPGLGLERLRGNLRLHDVSEAARMALQPRQILCGDFLDSAWLQHEAAKLMQVDRVINCAAVASFSNNPSIWPANVDGTFAFAQVMSQSKRLKRFLHVGTAMSCGPDCVSPVGESWAQVDADEHLVAYTASKAAIEQHLREALPALPLVVARPSIVVGHTRLGCQASASIFWMFRMALALESFTCDLDEQIDVIPVDYCARALITLACKPRLAHDLYHVSAGRESACSFADIDQTFARAWGCEPVHDRYRKIDVQDLPQLASLFESRIGPGNPRLIIRALRLYSGFAALNYVFDNQRLRAEGIAPSPRFTDYIHACVRSSSGVPITDQMQWDFK